MKQHAIAGFRHPEPRIFALHRLLRLDQLLLQIGEVAQIAPQRDDRAIRADLHRRIAHGHVGATLRRVVQFAELDGGLASGVLDQVDDLRPAFHGDDVGPVAADPVPMPLAPQILRPERDVADDAVAVHDQGDVAGRSDQAARHLGRKPPEPSRLTLETERRSLGSEDVHHNEYPGPACEGRWNGLEQIMVYSIFNKTSFSSRASNRHD